MGVITIPATLATFQYNFRTGFETPLFGRESSAVRFPLLGPQKNLFYLQFYSNNLGTSFDKTYAQKQI